MDKIVWLKEGELTADEWGAWKDVKFEHNLGAQLFVKGVFSFDDWNTIYPVGMLKNGAQVIEIRSQASATTTEVIFSGAIPSNNGKVKYRLWGVMSESDTKGVLVGPTVGQSANRIMLDTDKTYPMLIQEGYVNAGETVKHNLGRIPYMDIWALSSYDSSWFIFNDDNIAVDEYNLGGFIQITSSSITAVNNLGCPSKFYYRMYL